MLLLTLVLATQTWLALASQVPLAGFCHKNNDEPATASLDLGTIVRRFQPDLGPLETLYKDIHQHAELSQREARTSSVIASRLRGLGLHVHEGIGGHGVVGVLSNGAGPVVLLRAELDALPIEEQTGLDFSSTQRMPDSWGREQPVMHACGHDMHMACLMGSAELLRDARAEWNGTVMFLYQPNEEHTGGAQAMVDDGLYEKIPKPDVVMAQHLVTLPSGFVNIASGPILVSADTVQIRMYSSKGHAANPQVAAEVVVAASRVVLQLQDVVASVEKDGHYASIHVEQIHAGQDGADWVAHVDMVLDVKAYDPLIRSRLLDGIRDAVRKEAEASGAHKSPRIASSVRAPLTSNDEKLAAQMQELFSGFWGPDKVLNEPPKYPCEDFSILATAADAPYLLWFLGKVDPETFRRARQDDRLLDLVPTEHSPFNAPLMQPTMETGIHALSLAALSVLRGGGQKAC